MWWSKFCRCIMNRGILGTNLKARWVAMLNESMVDGVICPTIVCADTSGVMILATTCVIFMTTPSSRK